MAPHGDYDTRYDFLLGPGDKGPNTGIGPAFKYEGDRRSPVSSGGGGGALRAGQTAACGRRHQLLPSPPG
ncbi:DUF4839 domain-containing protein [Streptomyces sp. WI03-4A]|uniref:DUF4839 domain-containing protein n=1 Tax=Streptomyces sp. WI03-4A TaxID=3028706 RepID=UPI0029C0B052|nr:DUF4839 domain-containing protein [Streptomyces sp. WI03-4A]